MAQSADLLRDELIADPDLSEEDRRAFAAMLDARPGWDAIVRRREVLPIDDHVLLHAGPPFASSNAISPKCAPAGSVAMGSPAKVRREISDAERERIRQNAERYVELSREYIEAGLGESDDAGN